MEEKDIQSVEAEVMDTEEKYVSEQPEFDLDRLAKEIDGVFQEKMRVKAELLDTESVKILEKKNQELLDLFASYNEQVKAIFPDIKEELLAEIAKGRTVIVLPNRSEINVQHMDHPEMVHVVESLALHNQAMLVGPAGTGKTTMVKHIAERMVLPFYKYSCSRDSSVHDLIGYKQPASEIYLETVFLNAYENGGIFLVDEYDAMSGDMALFFNGIADNSDFISIPHRDTKPTATKHKDFYLVMCGNTWGKGSTDYSGRDFQDMALMDRFRFCRHHIGYHIELEKEFMGSGYSWIQTLRTELERVGSYLSTRNVEDISKALTSNITIPRIIAMVTQDLSDSDKIAIKDKMPSTMSTSNSINNSDYTGNLSACRVEGGTSVSTIKDVDGQFYSVSEMLRQFPPSNEGAMKHLQGIRPNLFREYRKFLINAQDRLQSNNSGVWM